VFRQDNLQAALPDLRIAVIGAGIGGLAAAIALKRVGFRDVTVYEQARAISEVGAGIQVR
jgi:2-polyprenyl-6-methoxyphenol hydroxylase-like FAD-dependent oxidoreductase